MKIKPFRFKHLGSSLSLVLKEEIDLPARGCFLITGNSGLGKSTFLQLLKGFYPEFLSGELAGDLEFFNNSHYLFQNPFAQIIHPKALSEFLFSMENKMFSVEKMQDKMSWLEAFRLLEIEQKETHMLSHGECQRLLLASLVASEPDWLFLDEPTAFLDFPMRQFVYQKLAELKKQLGIIIIDHHLDEIESICDGYFELTLNQSSPLSDHNEKEVEIRFYRQSKIPRTNDVLAKQSELSFFPTSHWRNQSLKVQNLGFGYLKGQELFKHLNFELNPGEVVTLVGPSGAGKSTLLQLILYELKKLEGEIHWSIGNEYISPKKIFDYVSFLFQNPENHFLFDTVEEELKPFIDQGKKEQVDQLLQRFKLQHLLTQSPYLLSEGQKRRLSLIITLLLDRPFLILDEPSFGQDQEQVIVIQKFVHELKQKGVSVLMVSHDPLFYTAISDRVIHLSRRVSDESK